MKTEALINFKYLWLVSLSMFLFIGSFVVIAAQALSAKRKEEFNYCSNIPLEGGSINERR